MRIQPLWEEFGHSSQRETCIYHRLSNPSWTAKSAGPGMVSDPMKGTERHHAQVSFHLPGSLLKLVLSGCKQPMPMKDTLTGGSSPEAYPCPIAGVMGVQESGTRPRGRDSSFFAVVFAFCLCWVMGTSGSLTLFSPASLLPPERQVTEAHTHVLPAF